jgi:lipooligosaccharide transport system permease protein
MAAPALRVLEAHARAYRHVWRGSVATTFLSPVLYLLAMGLGLGTLVDRGGGGDLAGTSYLAFLAPGLLAATAMQVAAADSSWPVMAGMKWRRTYHAALATPLRPRDLVAGHLTWLAVRLTFSTAVFAAVVVAFGAAPALGAAAAIAPAVLTGLAFAAPITAFAGSLSEGVALASLFRFGIVPMFLFSGTFFPISQLPGWLEPVAYAVPLWHGVQLARAAALGGVPVVPAAVSVAYLLAWLGVGALLATRVFQRRLLP